MSNRRLSEFALLCAFYGAHQARAGTVDYELTALSGGSPGEELFQYIYYLSGFNFVAGEELDFVFPANLFATLSNGVASAGFDVELFQPNSPPGVSGDFTAEASSNLGGVTGPWSVDVVYLGSGLPGPQPFFIDQFNSNGALVGDPDPGETDPVPEPGTFELLFLAAVASVLWRRRAMSRSRSVQRPQGWF